MDGRFLTAFVLPEKWEIMGYKLNAFSLRHIMTLTAIQSPLIDDNNELVLPEDIIVFLRVCSSKNSFVALKRPTLMDKWNKIRMEVDTAYFFKQFTEIRAYINTCNQAPITYTKDENKKSDQVPVVLGLVSSLTSNLHISLDEAWDMTAGQAIWYLTTYALSQGSDIKILTTQQEEKSIEQIKEAQNLAAVAKAKLKAEMNKNG